MSIDDPSRPLFIVSMNPFHHRYVLSAGLLRPLGRIRLAGADHIQCLIAFSCAFVLSFETQFQDFLGALAPFPRLWSDQGGRSFCAFSLFTARFPFYQNFCLHSIFSLDPSQTYAMMSRVRIELLASLLLDGRL